MPYKLYGKSVLSCFSVVGRENALYHLYNQFRAIKPMTRPRIKQEFNENLDSFTKKNDKRRFINPILWFRADNRVLLRLSEIAQQAYIQLKSMAKYPLIWIYRAGLESGALKSMAEHWACKETGYSDDISLLAVEVRNG